MQIFRELAGFSFGQADNVRRAMSKKKQGADVAVTITPADWEGPFNQDVNIGM